MKNKLDATHIFRKNSKIRAAIAAVFLVLAACGGGGGNDGSGSNGMTPDSGGGNTGSGNGGTGDGSGGGNGNGSGDGSGQTPPMDNAGTVSAAELNAEAHAARTNEELQELADRIVTALGNRQLEQAEADSLGSFIAARQDALMLPTIERAHREQTARNYRPLSVNLSQHREYEGGTQVTDENLLLNGYPFGDDEYIRYWVTNVKRNIDGSFTMTARFVDAEESIDESETVTFSRDNCDGEGCRAVAGDGDEYWLWGPNADDTLDGTYPGYDYLNLHHFQGPLGASDSRNFIVHGIDTPAAAMPNLGTATYSGRFRADAYRRNSTSREYRHRFQSSDLTLTSDFDTGTLTGEIANVRGSAPGRSAVTDRILWPTSSFSITDGRIDGNGFTATLTGHDSDPGTSDVSSVRGFTGEIDARFFGPTGGEVGGVLSAVRDLAGEDNDLNLYGYILGRHESE